MRVAPAPLLTLALLALVALVVQGRATGPFKSYPFQATDILSVAKGDDAPPSPNTSQTASAFVVRKAPRGARTSGVVLLHVPDNSVTGIGPNEYFHEVHLVVPVLASTSWNRRVRVGVRALAPTDPATATYATLPRLSDNGELLCASPANEAGGALRLDVTAAVQAGVRDFELVIVGGGRTAEVTLGRPDLILTYPAWTSSPVLAGADCAYVETPLPGVAAPGIVSFECELAADDLDDTDSNNRPTLLYHHGAPSGDPLFDDMPRFMLDAGRVVLPNLPGNGRSGDLDLDPITAGAAWGDLVADRMLAWVRLRGFQNVHLLGQDMGGPVSMAVAEGLAADGVLSHWMAAEAVGTDQLLCPSDATEGCFTDGSVPDGNAFMSKCFAQNQLGCADYVLPRNWFKNATLVADPQVHALAAQLGGQYVAIAYGAPCVEHVYNLLSTSCRDATHYDEHYCYGAACATVAATQAETFWPRSLHEHGQPVGQHSVWLRDTVLAARVSMKSGALAAVPKTIFCVDDTTPQLGFAKNIVKCRESDVAHARAYYPNMGVIRIGGNMGHFLTEDGFSGAYSLARGQLEAMELVDRAGH